ncbi:MAG TPA: DPP IV N-terminal domain-containing protein, partial [Phnomibacter sp.]|nr:DPP IV N-terminal domain-containing protein [Phnomibacter sp.]
MKAAIPLLMVFTPFTYCLCQPVTKDHYRKAVSFLPANLDQKKIFNARVDPVWADDHTGVAFVTSGPEGRQYQKLSRSSGNISPLFDRDRLANILKDRFGVAFPKDELVLTGLRWKDEHTLHFRAGNSNFALDLNTHEVSRRETEETNEMESRSPDGQWIAFSKDHNLYLRSTATGAVRQLSSAGYKNYEYATYYGWSDIMEGENGERPPHFRVNWSPDSKWIQTYICDLRAGNKMYLLDWSVDTLFRPRLLSYYRASPGDTATVRMIPVFFNVGTGEEWCREELRSTHVYPIAYQWSDKASGIIYQTNRYRGFQQIDLDRVDLNTKRSELLNRETSETNLDNFETWLVEEAGILIVASERSGWRQLFSIDLSTKVATPITGGAYYVNSIAHIDRKNKTIYFMASGKEPGRNPYYQHLYKIGLDGKGFALLSPENADHEVSVSPDGKFFTDNYSAPDQPTITVFRDAASGKILHELSRANVDGLMEMGYKFPETFTAIARDGKTTIYGAMWKPTHFDPSRKYPVIDQSYTGPHTNMFPRSFSMSINRRNQCLAELGFIVVTIDGMGTAGRSKAFHNVSYKNMGQNLLDHKLAIEQLAVRYSWIDKERVGIFGHSAGGFDAGHAVLEFPDFYKVAVASSADHDFRMEKDHWPEMYM